MDKEQKAHDLAMLYIKCVLDGELVTEPEFASIPTGPGDIVTSYESAYDEFMDLLDE